MKDQTYNIVRLDGQEYENVEYDLIREWYATRLINGDSLVLSSDAGKWQKLKNVFDLADLNAARNLFFQQRVPEPQPAAATWQSYLDQPQFYQQPVFESSLSPSGSGAGFRQPKKSSGWKLALVIGSVIFVLFAGIIGAGAYGFFKIAQTQAFKNSSGAGEEKFLAEMKKYEIPGGEFVDEKSGIKIILPKEWRMLKSDNPLVPIFNQAETEAQLKKDGLSDKTMLATDKLGNAVLLTEIVYFPERIDNVFFFDSSVKAFEDEIIKHSKPNSYKRIIDTTIPLSGNMAKKIVFERITIGQNPRMAEFGIDPGSPTMKGHMIVVSNDYYAVIMQMWTTEDNYDKALADFNFLETNLSIPKNKVR